MKCGALTEYKAIANKQKLLLMLGVGKFFMFMKDFFVLCSKTL